VIRTLFFTPTYCNFDETEKWYLKNSPLRKETLLYRGFIENSGGTKDEIKKNHPDLCHGFGRAVFNPGICFRVQNDTRRRPE
jgi:hypothetical protein